MRSNAVPTPLFSTVTTMINHACHILLQSSNLHFLNPFRTSKITRVFYSFAFALSFNPFSLAAIYYCFTIWLSDNVQKHVRSLTKCALTKWVCWRALKLHTVWTLSETSRFGVHFTDRFSAATNNCDTFSCVLLLFIYIDVL